MSANIPNNMLMSDLLKATGYDCPENLQGQTFVGATSGGTETQTKEVDITANGKTKVTPDSGKLLTEVTVNANVPVPETQEKTVSVTTNGQTVITPDVNKTLAKATVNVNVPSDVRNQEKEIIISYEDPRYIVPKVITPDAGFSGLSKVTCGVNFPLEDKIIIANGEYKPRMEGLFGYGNIQVNVQGKTEIVRDVTITENGTTKLTPDAGNLFKEVNITTNVQGGGNIQQSKTVKPTTLGTTEVTHDAGFDGMAKVIVDNSTIPLETKQINAVGSYTPSSPNVGFRSVSVGGTQINMVLSPNSGIYKSTGLVSNRVLISVDKVVRYFPYKRSTDGGATWNSNLRYLPYNLFNQTEETQYVIENRIKDHVVDVAGEQKFYAYLKNSQGKLDFANMDTGSFVSISVDFTTKRITIERAAGANWIFECLEDETIDLYL